MQELTEEQVMAQAAEAMGETDAAVINRNSLVFNAITEMVWPLMCESELGSCITGTRVAFDVCRHYDIKVSAHNTHVRVYNAPLLARIKGGQLPENEAQIDAWQKIDGSWNVGIGGFGYDQPGRFDGHLVAVALGRILLDTTLAQVNRPQHGIELESAPARLPVGWPIESDEPIQVITAGGCLLTYEPVLPDDRRWVATETWRTREIHGPLTAAVIAAVDSALAAL